MLEYEELRIRVRKVGTRRYLVLANGPATAADIVTLDQDPASYRAAFDHLIDVELGMAPQGDGNVTALLRKLGRDVFGALFSSRLADCVGKALGHARADGRDLRLRFDLPPELGELPVEAITSPADQPGRELALGGYSLARTLRGSPPGARLLNADSDPGPVHLLVAVAPRGGELGSIEVDSELARLREQLRPEPAVHLEVIQDVTRGHLEQWLDKHSDDPAAVLLMAHGWYDGDGGQGVVRLEGGDGDPVPGMVLGGMLAQPRRLRLVVLSLCDGASSSQSEPFSGLAQALIGCGVPAVVAMRNRVTDTAAGLFTPDLLTAVAQNKTIDEAVRIARRHIVEIPGHTSAEWATPTLFLHEACHSGWLFKVTEVGDGDPADPLREGADALRRLRNPGPQVRPATLLAAARFLRAQGQWEDLLDVAQTRLRSGRLAELNQLRDEAQVELAWTAAERLCALLADDAGTAEVDGAARVLADLGTRELAEVLTAEVAAARRLSGLVSRGWQAGGREDWEAAADCFGEVLAERPHGYLDARDGLAAAENERELATLYAACGEHLAADRWTDAAQACAELLARRPDGYRDTVGRRDYAAGRDAEFRQAWTAAATAYDSCREYRDAPARLAFARARTAAGDRRWAQARDQFAAAVALGLPDEGWGDYCAARLAEDGGDWPAAVAAYQRGAGSPGAPPDTAARRLLAEARLAIIAADWSRALTALDDARNSDGADRDTRDVIGGLAREVRELVRRRAETEEKAGDWAEAARLFGMLAADDPEAGARHAYALGRMAENTEDWQEAADLFEGLEYSDARLRGAYAEGRRHELGGQWDEAAGCFAAAVPAADAERRLRYATGRMADERGDWPGVISGFGELADDYADGAVRDYRCYARARIAARRDAWDEVIALVRGVAGHRAADAAALRTTAAGWQARNSGDWADAAARFGEVADAGEELQRLRDYCVARARELSGDWPGALDAYAALPDGFEDTSSRRAYALARRDELTAADQAAWEAVADAYTALPAEFADVAGRARYAAIRQAEAAGDWRAVLDKAADADRATDPELAVSAELRGYAAGRLAEDDELWPDAADAYGKVVGYRDATVRQWYAHGRDAEAAGLWEEADTAYQQSGAVRDAAARGRRVRRLLVAFPWVATLGSRELVADPSAADDPADPYQVLRPAGITPASPASEARQASIVLMKRFRKLTPEQRAASDELRLPAGRMRHDALLYLLSDPDRLRAQLAESAELADGESGGLLAELCHQMPSDAPLLTLLGGDRDGAMAAWRRRLREAPGDMRAAHNLAVACLRKAITLEENGAWELARPAWEEALACWAAVLADDAHWDAWRQARAACYRQPVTAGDASRLRWELARDLSGRLSQYASRHAERDRAQQAASYQDLALFLDVEQQGARALAECGGLPLPDGGTITSGLAYLRLAGLEEWLGRRVAELAGTAAPGQGPGNAELRRLRSSFSELAAAFTLGTQQRFDQALLALRDVPLQPLADLPPDCRDLSADPGDHLTRCEACGDFLRRNPAYTLLPGRWRTLQIDTVFHAVWAHLNIARTALTSGPDGLEAAMAHLADAMETARYGAMSVRTREAAIRMILGRAESLYRAEGPRRGDRLSEAITLVERGLDVAGDREKTRQELSAMLSDLLTSRGVWYSLDCRDHGIEPEYAKAEADQRRAFQCNPNNVSARNNFARRLVYNLSVGSPARWGPADLARIRDSLRLVHDGLLQTGENPLLLETLGNVLVMFEKYLGAHATVEELTSWVRASASDPVADDQAGTGGNRLLWNLCVQVRRDPMKEQVRAGLLAALEDLIETTGRERQA